MRSSPTQNESQFNISPVSPPASSSPYVVTSTNGGFVGNRFSARSPISNQFMSSPSSPTASVSFSNEYIDSYTIESPVTTETRPTAQQSAAPLWSKDTYALESHYSLPTPEVDDPSMYSNVRKGDLESWRPKSLKKPLMMGMAAYIIGCAVLYVVLWKFLNDSKGHVARSSPNIDWMFLFGPLILAQILSEWVLRLLEDVSFHNFLSPSFVSLASRILRILLCI